MLIGNWVRWVIVASQWPKKPTVFNSLFTAIVWEISFPGRKHYKSYVINEEHISRIWQDFIDENMQYCRWRIAPLKPANKTALIGIAIYIRIKSVRHSVVWHCSSYQRDPHWESFTRSKTLIDTSGNAVWHHMLGFKSNNTTLPPTPALLTYLIEQMLTLCWERGFLFCFAEHLWWV